MSHSVPAASQPITADDETIRRAIAEAHLTSLTNAVVHLTGDTSLLDFSFKQTGGLFGDPLAGIPLEYQEKVRARAFEAIRNWLDQGQPPLAPPSPDTVRLMIDFIIAQPLPEEYLEYVTSELSINGEDGFRPETFEDIPPEVKANFKAIVIGAGLSGLIAGVRLKQAGIPFEIIEKNAGVGGTWYENNYPGCRVDSPNHTYSFSFAPNDWPQYFSKQEVLRQYFERVVKEFELTDHLRLNTKAVAAHYDEVNQLWTLKVRNPDGQEETLVTNALISAVGQLNHPRIPEIPGQESFEGISFHSARWEHHHDLVGKKIAVIGTGASAFQFVPEIAKQAAEVIVFQRTPPWIAPTPEYHADVPDGIHWMINNVPYYDKWFRFWMFWRTAEGLLGAVKRDPAWQEQERSISPANDQLRAMLTGYIAHMCGEDKDLFTKAVPRYPVGGKRMLRDNGNWLRALRRDNVKVVTDGISEIKSNSIVSNAGESFDCDVIVYGTGFNSTWFLFPMEVKGLGGLDLHELWNGDPKAYLGITVAQFPNLFCLYGPNTNIVVNGSTIFFSECEVRYVMGCLHLLMSTGHRALNPRQEIQDAYNEMIDAGNQEMAWGAPNVNSWYKNAKGRVTQNWPFSMLEYWNRTRAPEPKDYHLL